MDKQEKKFREFFQDIYIQFDMKRLDRAGVSPVTRATSIMALRRIFNKGEVNESFVSNNQIDVRHSHYIIDFAKHVNAVIKEMEVAQ